MNLKSLLVSTCRGMGSTKLGHPVPLSNLAPEVKSGNPQAAHTKVPSRFSSMSGLLQGRSVPSSKSTWYDSGGSSLRHAECGLSILDRKSVV
jgi:hypothetical protein